MPRPSLLAALLCERVLIEKDEVVSVVRVADHVLSFVQPGTSVVPVPLTLFLSFRALEPSGPFALRVEVAERDVPSKKQDILTAQLTFPASSLGANAIHPLGGGAPPVR